MKLWGGRFTKETNQLVHNFNASLSFDQKFYKQDIRGSIAHVTMLVASGIISDEDKNIIIGGLKGIEADIESGALQITEEHEDIHSFVEAHLIERVGEPGKRLHTGRSRNDQVALDMKLYTRDEVKNIDELLKSLLKVILRIMKENVHTYMPGFTHLQKAQPITVAHHFGAYFEMFKRDRSRLSDIYDRMNYCPLGSGALAGTTYPLDREMTASLLDFYGPTLNSMDSVADRDYLIELLSAMSTIMMHLSRFSEEIIVWNTNEYRFVELDDAYSTGSSIMPQKKNPDIAELVRGKTGRVYGALMSMLTTMKGLPLAYNKDMQEDKEFTFDAIDTTKGCISLFTGMIDTMTFNKNIMEVRNIYARNNLERLAIKNLSLELKAGEILGIAGIEGNGQSELVEVLTGMRELAQGEIYIRGKKLEKISPLTIREGGVAHVPEDRLSMGLSKDATIMENLLMGSQRQEEFMGKFNRLRRKNSREMSKKLIEEFDIRTPSEESLLGNLSGGNMQKVVIAREFNFNTPILIISQPTRGVDIGAIEFIHGEIIKKRNQGVAILLVSAELDEIFRLSDRIVTMYEGRITGEFKAGEITRKEIGLYMTGKTMEEGEKNEVNK